MYGTESWGGNLKTSYWKVFEKGMKMQMMSHVTVRSLNSYHILLAEFEELPINYMLSSLLWAFNHGSPTYPPLGYSVKQPPYPNTWLNRDLTLGTIMHEN